MSCWRTSAGTAWWATPARLSATPGGFSPTADADVVTSSSPRRRPVDDADAAVGVAAAAAAGGCNSAVVAGRVAEGGTDGAGTRWSKNDGDRRPEPARSADRSRPDNRC